MNIRPISMLLCGVLTLTPILQATAKHHNDDRDDHKHHTSSTEKIVAGLAIAGLATLAANEDNRDYGTGPDPYRAPRSTSITIYTSRGPTPIFLQATVDGYVGPRGEFYSQLPSREALTRAYGGGGGGYRPSPQPNREWDRGGNRDDRRLDAQVEQGRIRIAQGGRTVCVCRTASPTIEKWKFDNNDSVIIVKSRGNHGPATVEKFSTQDGAQLDKVLAFAIKDGGARWARGFED